MSMGEILEISYYFLLLQGENSKNREMTSTYTTQSLIGNTFLMHHNILTSDLIESKIET